MLIIYDKNEINFNGYGLGILDNGYNVRVREVLNGEYTLSFSLPYSDEKMIYISPLNLVKVEDQLFRIKEIEDQNNKGLVCNIRCDHVSAELNSCKFVPLIQHFGISPVEVLQEVLNGTPYTLGACEITTLTDIDLTKVNPMKVISKLIENVGGELERNNYTISLRERRGSNSGVQFRIGKNIQTITLKTDSSGLVTRLYPFGEDDLDISTVNDGLHYMDSQYIDDYSTPFVAHNEYRDIKDPSELMNKGLSEFSTEDYDGIDKPKITYNCSIVELKKLKEYGDVERFFLGDTVRVVDESLGIDTIQRVMEYERYPYEPSKSSVVLSNVRAEYYKKSTLNGTLANIKRSSDKIDNVTNGNRIIAQYVDNIREKLQTEVNDTVEKALLHNTPDMYVDNVNNPTKAMLIGAGIFAIANSKKINGDWNWRTIATGDRVIADEVDANWVYAGGINADQITAGKITADRIDATNLQVSSANITGTITADTVDSDWVYAGNIVANQISTAIPDSKISSASTWNSKINANDAVTIVGNTVNAPFINALNIQAATVKSDWVYAGNINANQINAGTISANIISGGTLSGVTLNVSTNATIGSKLTVGSATGTNKTIQLYSGTSGTTSITTDSNGKMYLNNYNDIVVNSGGQFFIGTDSINMITIDDIDITSGGNIHFNSDDIFWNNKPIATLDDIENTASSIVVSDTAPTDHTKIWIDISNL